METLGYAVDGPTDKFHPWKFQRREVGDHDILIKIEFCGICHSDVHNVRSEWGPGRYPMVPGHEIVGKVEKVGSKVTTFRVGDSAAVGCMVDSCLNCDNCSKHEGFCEKGFSGTYASFEQDKKTPTYGGYSRHIVVKEHFTCRIPEGFKDLAPVAPLLCAGITTYSPLNRYKHMIVGKKVGIVGLGGLGHVGVKIAAAMGAEVTVFSTSDSKREDAQRLGAKHFVNSKNEEEMKKVRGTFSLILNTVSSFHEAAPYVQALVTEGVLVYVGASPEPITLPIFPLLLGNKSIVGSLIGGMKETQEMLEFCALHNIVSDIEMVGANELEQAYDRIVKGDVKYRFVIDINTLAE